MMNIRRLETRILKYSQSNSYESSMCRCAGGSIPERKYSIGFNHVRNSRFSEIVLRPHHTNCLISNSCLLKFSSPAVGLTCNNIQKATIHSWFESYSSLFMSLSESTPVITTMQLLTYIHESSGLPWWATIALTTAVFRGTVTTPLALYQHYILAKVENLKLELSEKASDFQKEIYVVGHRNNWSKKKAKRIYSQMTRQEWRKLVERDNCHPAKGAIVVLFQLPGWIFLSMSIRNFASMRPFHDEAAVVTYNQLKSEGLLWIPDLTLTDTTLIVPSFICLLSLGIIELHALSQIKELTTFQKNLNRFFRLIAIIAFPLSAMVPSCLSFYWLCSTAVGLGQNILLMSPRIRTLAGIPKTNSTLTNPYRHVLQQLDQRLQRFGLRKA